MINGIFPTPYPDECLYSILCRLYSRCGGTLFDTVRKTLFGGKQSLSATIYMPIRVECIDSWAPKKSGITREWIATNHTMHPYFSVSYAPNFREEMEAVLNGGVPSKTHDRTISYNSRSSWLKFLRYCPLCAAEDISGYGEAYWHRKHQLPGYHYCAKHLVRLVDSKISVVKSATNGFYPASSEVCINAVHDIDDVFQKHHDKCLKIGHESDWLLENGLRVDWEANGRERYAKLFRDTGIVAVGGTRFNTKALTAAVYEYWGGEFLDALFEETPGCLNWLSYVHVNRMSSFLPLQHILLMCVAKDTVKDFVESDVSDNPFGVGLLPCENLICPHHNTDIADCIDVCNYSGRIVCFYRCPHCGMTYKKTKGMSMKGVPVIVDYGHLWTGEFKRCVLDNTTDTDIAKILNVSQKTIIQQKKNLGLLRPPRYDMPLGHESFYKNKVIELHGKHDELTVALLEKEVPGAYDYLFKNHLEWLRKYVVHYLDTKFYRQKRESLPEKVRIAVEQIKKDEEVCPQRRISYNYIADVAGVKREEFRRNKSVRSYLDGIVETKESWYKRRITYVYQNLPAERKSLSVFQICCKASISDKPYKKYRKFLTEVVNELKANEPL